MKLNSEMTNVNGELAGYRNNEQLENDKKFKDLALEIIKESGANWSIHGLSVMKRNSIARIIYYYDLYQKSINVPGVICEFGVHWGAGMATLLNLRSILEPYNSSRHIIGFDTFEGFASTDKKDGKNIKDGDYIAKLGHEEKLSKILKYHESIAPFPEAKKHQLVKGNVLDTVPKFLLDNSHLSISMAIFDMDIYKPTKVTLEQIIERMPKGALLVFDEFNCSFFPGETQAVNEVLGIKNLKLQRHPMQTYCAFCVL
jgi:hypothetical protein